MKKTILILIATQVFARIDADGRPSTPLMCHQMQPVCMLINDNNVAKPEVQSSSNYKLVLHLKQRTAANVTTILKNPILPSEEHASLAQPRQSIINSTADILKKLRAQELDNIRKRLTPSTIKRTREIFSAGIPKEPIQEKKETIKPEFKHLVGKVIPFGTK